MASPYLAPHISKEIGRAHQILGSMQSRLFLGNIVPIDAGQFIKKQKKLSQQKEMWTTACHGGKILIHSIHSIANVAFSVV